MSQDRGPSLHPHPSSSSRYSPVCWGPTGELVLKPKEANPGGSGGCLGGNGAVCFFFFSPGFISDGRSGKEEGRLLEEEEEVAREPRRRQRYHPHPRRKAGELIPGRRHSACQRPEVARAQRVPGTGSRGGAGSWQEPTEPPAGRPGPISRRRRLRPPRTGAGSGAKSRGRQVAREPRGHRLATLT